MSQWCHGWESHLSANTEMYGRPAQLWNEATVGAADLTEKVAAVLPGGSLELKS